MTSTNTHNVFVPRFHELLNAAMISDTEQAFATIEHVHYTCHVERDLSTGKIETIVLTSHVKHGNDTVIEMLVAYDIIGIARLYSDSPIVNLFVMILDDMYHAK